MDFFAKKKQTKEFKFTGTHQLMDGTSAVIMCEKESTDAAGAYFSSPHSKMSALWNQAKAEGHLNIANRPLISVNPEDNQAASTVTAGLALSGLRATHFNSSAQSVASLHESLYAAVGKRLPYTLNIVCKSVTKATSNHHCSHDDYHSMDNTGIIQLFARNNQSAADLTIIAKKVAELSLNPAAIAQDGFFTADLLAPIYLPERELIEEYLGLADDIINSPTPSQSLLFGKTRRRIPETWSIEQPVQSGGLQQSDSYMQTVAGQRPFFFDHVTDITDQCMTEWFELTGRQYHRINQYRCKDADYLIFAQGSILNTAEVTADYLRQQHELKVGVVDMTVFRPFPGDLISHLAKGLKGILVLERSDQPLSEDLPIITEIRNCISKAIDNGKSNGQSFADHASYNNASDAPPLYSACFGLGGHTITAGDIIAAVENMLPDAKQQKFAYLGIEFVHSTALSPQQEIQQQAVIDAYPNIADLAIKSARNVTLKPSNVNIIRIHARAKQSEQLGKILANILFDQFNQIVHASPSITDTQHNQPHTFYLATSAEKQRIIEQHEAVDSVIVTDATIFSYTNPLANINDNGIFIIQSSLSDVKDVWRSFPHDAQKTITDKHVKVYFIDAPTLALQVSDDINQQAALQNCIFKSVFFKVSNISEQSEEDIQPMIDINLSLVKQSYLAVNEIIVSQMTVGDTVVSIETDTLAPLRLQQKPANNHAIADIHRFWNQSANLKNDTPADPFMALGIVPASSGIFGDISNQRTQHPQWIAENCTACGNCYNVCPDSAIPGLINTVNEVFETNIRRVEKLGHTVKHLRRAIRTAEKKYHALTVNKSVGTTLDPIFAKAIGDTIKEYAEHERADVSQEFEWFKAVSGSFKFALTEPYHDEMNRHMPHNGGLFSITINPNSCKGCMECVTVCEPQALNVIEQSEQSLLNLRDNWDYWLDLPTSNKKFSQVDDLNTKEGVLDTLLLDKKNHDSSFNADNSAAGSGEKAAIHLFTSTVTALMQPRVEQHIKHITQLINDLEKHTRMQLVNTLDISDIDALETAIDENQSVDLTLSRLSGALDKNKATQPIDSKWLRWILQLTNKLKHLKTSYSHSLSGEGRASLGITESSHSDASHRAAFPFNPYPFPWASHLSQDAPSLALGLFEGQMVKMAEGFKAIRTAELEIKGRYKKAEHDTFFAYFDWQQFSDEEYLLCPPLVSLGLDGTSFDSGFQNISNSLLSGAPIKLLVLDNQVSDNATKKHKELGLIAMAHQSSYVQQCSLSNRANLLAGYIDGLNYRGAALWTVYTAHQPENGLANNSLSLQSKLALESRAYPLYSFNPTQGKTWEECLSLSGNPDLEQDWMSYTLDYTDEYGNKFSMDVPLTYADWALTEIQFDQHFKAVSADADSDDMVLLTEYLEMSSRDQAESLPFIWATHLQSNHLLKVVVSEFMVSATQERKDFWHTLKGLSGNNRIEVDTQAIADQARGEMAQSITEGLMSMMGGDASALSRILSEVPAVSTHKTSAPAVVTAAKAPPAEKKAKTSEKPTKKTTEKVASVHEAVWIETPDCTTCDECVDIAPGIFQYNADKKAIVIDPTKGTFEDIVRSAEKCTAVIIHPGTPWNPDEPNLETLIKRAEKFQ